MKRLAAPGEDVQPVRYLKPGQISPRQGATGPVDGCLCC